MAGSFLDLKPPYNVYEGAQFALLPIPYDAMKSSDIGARGGPAAIIDSSQHLEEFDEELEQAFCQCGIATLEPVQAIESDPFEMQEAIFERAVQVVRDGKFLFGLGGDHSVSTALVRAVMSGHPPLSVLQIDAHPDLRETYMGTPYSHACVMRRVLELGVPIVQVGVRSICSDDHQFIKQHAIPTFSARTCLNEPGWVERVVAALGDAVYVTVDIDGFDPSFAPGTGTPEPGGLDWYQVTRLLRRVAAERRIVGADVVEVAPIPGQMVTEFLAARLAYKLIAYVLAGSATN